MLFQPFSKFIIIPIKCKSGIEPNHFSIEYIHRLIDWNFFYQTTPLKTNKHLNLILKSLKLIQCTLISSHCHFHDSMRRWIDGLEHQSHNICLFVWTLQLLRPTFMQMMFRLLVLPYWIIHLHILCADCIESEKKKVCWFYSFVNQVQSEHIAWVHITFYKQCQLFWMVDIFQQDMNCLNL